MHSWGQSLSPGNEQRYFWSSDFAERPGSRNVIGIRDPVIDTLIEFAGGAASRTGLDGDYVNADQGALTLMTNMVLPFIVDNTIRGVKKVASLGLARDDSYEIEEAEKGSGDPAKIKLFQF